MLKVLVSQRVFADNQRFGGLRRAVAYVLGDMSMDACNQHKGMMGTREVGPLGWVQPTWVY